MLQAQVSRFPPNLGQVEYNGCRGIREGKMRAFKNVHSPPEEASRCFNSYSGPDESVENACLEHLPQVLPTSLWPVPPSTPTRRRGGARAATLAFCAHLWSSDGDGPGPLRCSGSDLDLLGMKDLKAAERAFASLNFSTTVSTEVPKSSEGETGASSRKPLSFLPISARFTHRCLSVTTMAAIDLPIAVAACLVARRAKSVVRRSSATSSGDKPWPLSRVFQQISLVSLKHRHRVQRSNSLTCCCICLAI